jgi:hypothetical protein
MRPMVILETKTARGSIYLRIYKSLETDLRPGPLRIEAGMPSFPRN